MADQDFMESSAEKHPSFWLVARAHVGRMRVALENARNQGFVCYDPMFRDVRLCVHSLYPPYFFVKLAPHAARLRSTRGVAEVVMSGECYSRVPDAEIARVRATEGPDGYIVLPDPPAFSQNQPVIYEAGGLMLRGVYQTATIKERCRCLFNMLGALRSIEVNERELTAAA